MRPFTGPTLPKWRYFAYVRDKGSHEAAVAFRDWLVKVGSAPKFSV